MKTRRLLFGLLLAVSIFYTEQSRSQGTTTLFVDTLIGFPDLPQDTAYEGQAYAFDILVINNTNTFINNNLTIYMLVDSLTDTMVVVPQATIQPNDSLVLSVTGFNFNQPLFKAGNNIVVVWPVVSGLALPVDSLYTDVYFVPLNSLGDTDLIEPSFRLFPVPATNMLHFDFSPDNRVEYVRIFASTGQLVRAIPWTGQHYFDISQLRSGVYMLEVTVAGKTTRRKFIKE